MQNIQLSPHFELREFIASRTAKEHGIDNTPPNEAVENLRALCVHTLEPLREALGLPIIITSGYRNKTLNQLLVFHSTKSQHMNGEAADFYVAQGPVQGRKAASSRFKVQSSMFKVRAVGNCSSRPLGLSSWTSASLSTNSSSTLPSSMSAMCVAVRTAASSPEVSGMGSTARFLALKR